jgi:hypothetical protein
MVHVISMAVVALAMVIERVLVAVRVILVVVLTEMVLCVAICRVFRHVVVIFRVHETVKWACVSHEIRHAIAIHLVV